MDALQNQIDLILSIARTEHIIDYSDIIHVGESEYDNSEYIKSIIEQCVGIYRSNNGDENQLARFQKIIGFVFSDPSECYIYYRMINLRVKSNLNRMIVKWNPPIPGQMKIKEVVDDIFTNILRGDTGLYHYWNGRDKQRQGKYCYSLFVLDGVGFFKNAQSKTIYKIVIDHEGESGCAKLCDM